MVGFREYDEQGGLDRTVGFFLTANHLDLWALRVRLVFGIRTKNAM